MARQRITQSDVARELGIGQPSVSKRLSGQVPFDVDQLAKLSALLGVSIERLLNPQDRSGLAVSPLGHIPGQT